MFFITPKNKLKNIDDNLEIDIMIIESIFKLIFDEEEQKLFLCNEPGFTIPNTEYKIIFSDIVGTKYKLGISYSSYQLIFESDFESFSIQIYKRGIRSKFIRSRNLDDYFFFIAPDNETVTHEVGFSTFTQAVVDELIERFR